jgi:hypothetical protein
MKQLPLFDIGPEETTDLVDDIYIEEISELKICRICLEEKSVEEFYRDRGAVYSRCKECIKKEKKILSELKKVAPKKPDQCECCKKPVEKKMCLDHYHDSCKFRGWVCTPCNVGIGLLGDNLDGVINAVNYLLSRKENTA